MSAFDDGDRCDIDPAGHLIGQFDYLNTSARQAAQRVRALVDEMLARYPEPHRPDLIRRIRSREDGTHLGAAFEIVVHELMLRQGFRIVEIEPRVANGRSPDFLVEHETTGRFFLEATVALGPVASDPGADRRMRDALQAIDNVASPNFFLSVHPRGWPASPVPIGKLRKKVQRFVDNLEPEDALAAVDAGRPLPQMEYSHDGLDIRIGATPKRHPGKLTRAIGFRMLPGGIVTPHEAIRDSIFDKASRYGELDLPYVVAINAMEEYADEDSAMDASFGTEAVAINEDGGHRWIRNRDGVWFGAGGPQHRRVSAILSTERLTFWSLGQRRMRLISNPWATRPLTSANWRVDKHEVTDERLRKEIGVSVREQLELPDGWPEQ